MSKIDKTIGNGDRQSNTFCKQCKRANKVKLFVPDPKFQGEKEKQLHRLAL